MNQIKKGDVVKLKSGGPLMTVNEIDQEEVYCVWFLNDKPEYGSFDKELLVLSNQS